MSVLIFFAILLLLVIVHEFGHFIVAKKSGVRVDEFAFGFPPRLWSVKKGETEYSFNALPIGGYVKIYGENPEEIKADENNKRSLIGQTPFIQAAIISAGVISNLLLAWILMSAILMIGIYAPFDSSGAYTVENPRLMITEIMDESPAQKSGLKPGDFLLRLSDKEGSVEIAKQDDVINFIKTRENSPVIVTFERKGEERSVSSTPIHGISPNGAAIGIYMDAVGTLRYPFFTAVTEGFMQTVRYTRMTIIGIADFLWNVIIGQSDFSNVSGPVGIVHAAGDAFRVGFSNILLFTAVISINLAVINFIPFPALDGGRLLFVIIEALIKRKINPKVFQVLNQVGFALLLLLMVVVTYHDIAKLI